MKRGEILKFMLQKESLLCGFFFLFVFFSFFHIWWAFSVGRDNISCPGRPGDAII